jgi:hypothetical protein
MDKREIRQMMELLQIEDVTTKRQLKNGTITWRLPIKIGSGNRNIEVGSFKSGYIRNNNCGYSNYQLNKRCESEPQYYPEYAWDGNKRVETGKYHKYTTRGCVLIPNELERLEYLIKYCVKNYYVKHANFVANGDYIPKWEYDNLADAARLDYERNDGALQNLSVTVNGERYNII